MTPSDHVTDSARWFLFSSALIVSTTAVFRVGASIGWRPVLTVLLYVTAALTGGYLAVVAASWIRSRHRRRSITVGLRLERIPSPRHAPGRDPGLDVRTPAGFGDSVQLCSPVIDRPVEHLSPSASDLAPDVDDRTLDGANPPLGTDREPVLGTTRDRESRRSLESQFRVTPPSNVVPRRGIERTTSPSSIPAEQQSTERHPGNERDDARRLAEVLNLYERLGYLPDEALDDSDSNRGAVDGLPAQRGLWDELVEVHGAASIDFRGADQGDCVITLASGNVVFYAPEQARWVWISFDRAEAPAQPGARLVLSDSGDIVAR